MQKARINAYNIKMAVKLKQEKEEQKELDKIPVKENELKNDLFKELYTHYLRLCCSDKFTYYDDEFHIPVKNGVKRA